MNPKPTTGFAIMLPDGWMHPATHGSAKEARKNAYLFLPASDPDHSWQHCYKLGYRVIPVTITPRKR